MERWAPGSGRAVHPPRYVPQSQINLVSEKSRAQPSVSAAPFLATIALPPARQWIKCVRRTSQPSGPVPPPPISISPTHRIFRAFDDTNTTSVLSDSMKSLDAQWRFVQRTSAAGSHLSHRIYESLHRHVGRSCTSDCIVDMPRSSFVLLTAITDWHDHI